jgi:hypothetical protein
MMDDQMRENFEMAAKVAEKIGLSYASAGKYDGEAAWTVIVARGKHAVALAEIAEGLTDLNLAAYEAQ